MKDFLILFFMVTACSMGSKPPVERKDQDKLWRPCQDFEVQTGSPVGKMCNRTCIKKDDNKCKMWKQNVKDFNNKEDFEFFRSSSFIFIDEDNL